MSRELVSICIPTYRGGARLQRLFEQWPHDAREDIEVFVHDDGSPEEDGRRITEAMAALPVERKKLIRRSENRGIIACVNDMIASSSGKIIFQLDDDILLPFSLMGLARDLFTPGKGHLPNIGVASWRSCGMNPGQSLNHILGLIEPTTQLASYCMAFRREVYDEIGGFDPRFRVYCGDSDFTLRATLAGHPSYRVWWPLVPHEEHGAFKDARELDRNSIAQRDLDAFACKWQDTINYQCREPVVTGRILGSPGEAMEQIALAWLRIGKTQIHKVRP